MADQKDDPCSLLSETEVVFLEVNGLFTLAMISVRIFAYMAVLFLCKDLLRSAHEPLNFISV